MSADPIVRITSTSTITFSSRSYMFPKQFLSPHFWSIQQRFQFTTEMLQSRLYHQLPVLRFLQDRLKQLRTDEESYLRMRHVLGRLGSGQHATVDDVLAMTAILSRAPYSIESLPQHVLVSAEKLAKLLQCVMFACILCVFIFRTGSRICAAFTASIVACASDRGSPTTPSSSITWTWRFDVRVACTICRSMRWCGLATYAD